MYEIKKRGYLSILIIFIITAITYILGIVYISGEYFLGMKLLPESIWDFLDSYFYQEAGPLRLAMTVAIFILLSILLIVFYRNEISKTTTVLHTLIPIITILWWISAYGLSAIFADRVVIGIGCTILSVFCIIHTISTVILLIRDKNKINI